MRANRANYAWECPSKCLPPIETGIAVTTDISAFERDVVRQGTLCSAPFANPIPASHVPAAKVFAAQILYHFIECTWGGCYNSVHRSFLVPHFDSPEALDYVLKSPVIRDAPGVVVGTSGARVYPELLMRLRAVVSPKIQKYLDETFPA